jgi:hypothetical protein
VNHTWAKIVLFCDTIGRHDKKVYDSFVCETLEWWFIFSFWI